MKKSIYFALFCLHLKLTGFIYTITHGFSHTWLTKQAWNKQESKRKNGHPFICQKVMCSFPVKSK
jgi:hypothetical protein